MPRSLFLKHLQDSGKIHFNEMNARQLRSWLCRNNIPNEFHIWKELVELVDGRVDGTEQVFKFTMNFKSNGPDNFQEIFKEYYS
jgi:hypothetical protein